MKFAIYTGFVLGVLGIVFGILSAAEVFMIPDSIFFGSSTIALVLSRKE